MNSNLHNNLTDQQLQLFNRAPPTEQFEKENYDNNNVFTRIADMIHFSNSNGENETIQYLTNHKIDYERYTHIRPQTIEYTQNAIQKDFKKSNWEQKSSYLNLKVQGQQQKNLFQIQEFSFKHQLSDVDEELPNKYDPLETNL